VIHLAQGMHIGIIINIKFNFQRQPKTEIKCFVKRESRLMQSKAFYEEKKMIFIPKGALGRTYLGLIMTLALK